ncbi:MAG: hypothetical protein EXR17_00135 [Flavobacteriaceae bacterium]|nr:hypothetical protein [Flavobacteriaceae bacterium]
MRTQNFLPFVFSFLWINLASCQQTQKNNPKINKDSFSVVKIPKSQLQFFSTTPPVLFWSRVITTSKDSCIVVHKDTRRILKTIGSDCLDTLVKYNKLDSLADWYRNQYNYDSVQVIKFVRGKKDFFDFSKVGILVDDAKKIFELYNVNPIYAQFILLIESPNNPKASSSSGAVGHYQLMPFVAKKYKLVVSKARDDRQDFDKSSMAAAKLLRDYCIPNARNISISIGLSPDENALWFQLLVMHVYNAGAGNVRKAVLFIGHCSDGNELILTLWKTHVGAFGNSSQNYSQLALASYVNYMQWMQ